jgi:hypothetical protein
VTEIQKKFLPAVPRSGPEAAVNRIKNDFHGSGVNILGSSPFLPNR